MYRTDALSSARPFTLDQIQWLQVARRFASNPVTRLCLFALVLHYVSYLIPIAIDHGASNGVILALRLGLREPVAFVIGLALAMRLRGIAAGLKS